VIVRENNISGVPCKDYIYTNSWAYVEGAVGASAYPITKFLLRLSSHSSFLSNNM